MARMTNLTAGATLAPPGYITSPSGTFSFGFRALDSSDLAKFLLATRFRSGDGDDNSSQPQPQSVVWFAKQSPSGTTPNSKAQSVLTITTDGRLGLHQEDVWVAGHVWACGPGSYCASAATPSSGACARVGTVTPMSSTGTAACSYCLVGYYGYPDQARGSDMVPSSRVAFLPRAYTVE